MMDNAYTPLQRRTRKMFDTSQKVRLLISNFNVAYARGKGTNLYVMEQSLRGAMAELQQYFADEDRTC